MKRLFPYLFVIILSACGQGSGPKQSAETNTLSEGFELVDQGRYEEALVYFQKIFESQPSDNALKAWASVYVARAGLKVSSLYNAFSTFPSETKVTQENILVQIQTYKKSLDTLPYIKGPARADLQSATALLKARNSSSVRLFRGVLNLVMLRSTFADGDKMLLDANAKLELDKAKNGDIKIMCKLDWKKMRGWLQTWTLYGLELKQDLDYAYPSKKKNWQDGEKFFSEARKLSTTLVKECS